MVNRIKAIINKIIAFIKKKDNISEELYYTITFTATMTYWNDILSGDEILVFDEENTINEQELPGCYITTKTIIISENDYDDFIDKITEDTDYMTKEILRKNLKEENHVYDNSTDMYMRLKRPMTEKDLKDFTSMKLEGFTTSEALMAMKMVK